MDDNRCPKTIKCPIFSGVLKGTNYSEVYKRLYCEAGAEGRNRCKRFQAASVMGIYPPNVLPNSTKTVDEIVAEMKKAAAA